MRMTIRLATIEDMEGVKTLLRKYHRDTISDEDRTDAAEKYCCHWPEE